MPIARRQLSNFVLRNLLQKRSSGASLTGSSVGAFRKH